MEEDEYSLVVKKTDLANNEQQQTLFLKKKEDLLKTVGPQSSLQLKLIKCYLLICGNFNLSISSQCSTIDLILLKSPFIYGNEIYLF